MSSVRVSIGISPAPTDHNGAHGASNPGGHGRGAGGQSGGLLGEEAAGGPGDRDILQQSGEAGS